MEDPFKDLDPVPPGLSLDPPNPTAITPSPEDGNKGHKSSKDNEIPGFPKESQPGATVTVPSPLQGEKQFPSRRP